MFLLMALRWRRFLEYWPPFAILFAAFTFGADDADGAVGAHDSQGAAPIEWPRWIPARFGMAVLVFALGVAGVVNAAGARAEIRDLRDPFAMRGASAWLADHTPDGLPGIQHRLGGVPRAFLLRPAQRLRHRPRPQIPVTTLSRIYGRSTIALPKEQEKHPGPLIRERFGAEYVVARSDSTDFLNAAKASGDFDTVYSDEYASVLHVR